MRRYFTRRDLLTTGAAAAVGASLHPLTTFGQTNPAAAGGPVMISIEPETLETVTYSALFPDNTHILDHLPNQDSDISSFVFEADGSISYLVANVAAKGQMVVIKQDYSKSVPYKRTSDNVNYRVGIAIRVTAEVKVLKGDVNLGGLFNLGLAAHLNQVTGSLKVGVLGISGSSITNAIPATAQLTPESIQGAIEAIANIKSRIYDSEQTPASTTAPVKIVPQYIAKQVTGTLTKDRNRMMLVSGQAGRSPNAFLNKQEIR
jgi:hypothetical protein